MALVLDDTAIRLITVAAGGTLFVGWVGLRRRSARWLRSGAIGQGRLWAIDTFAHMTFGGVMGMIIAVLSMCLFRITIAHYAGITGVSIALDRTQPLDDFSELRRSHEVL